MGLLWAILAVLGLAIALYVVGGVYLATVLKWEDEQTVGLNYYGLPLAERRAFKERLRAHARRLSPMLALNGKLAKLDFGSARITLDGVSGPTGSCSAESFARAKAYRPRAEDVFVATQMKCGTTWMQHVVYEVVHRGRGTLVETGVAMYAVAPWLEGRKSVGIDDAPLIGEERPTRIIKTHMPVQLCPFDQKAKYIYVARHPLSCFASCIDFVDTNVGAMAPGIDAFEKWFTSAELMWWGTWTDHVKGWWDLAQHNTNVHFVYFEDMKRDLRAVAIGVAAFLGMNALTEEELAHVVHKCGFDYMQTHQENFEMHPPHILQTNAELFVAGTADRYKSVPQETRNRIAAWVAREMADSSFPLAQRYPDVALAGAS